MKKMKIVVVGGVAAGASAATRARRMNDGAEIKIFEMGEYVSFANCGLPYYVGGVIKDREDLLLVSPELFKNRFNIGVFTRHEVTAIDRASKTITVVPPDGNSFTESYDKLILALGGEPVMLPVAGAELQNVCSVFTVPDVDRVMAAIKGGVSSAVVVGGGFIGVETAEALLERGIKTTLVELQNQLMTGFDPEFSLPLERHLEAAGLDIRLGVSLTGVNGSGVAEGVTLSDGTELPAQLVIMAVGVRPRTALAKAAGLTLGLTGALSVNASMQTSDPDIYAAGDMIESMHLVTGKPMRIPLAGSANKEGRVAGTNAAGGSLLFNGVLGTSVIKVCDITAARTGLSSKQAADNGFDAYSIFVPAASHASYYPGSGRLILKLTVEKGTGRILGAQAVGESGVDKRIDVIATALYAGLTVYDLENLDLAYAPPYSSAKDPVIMGGMIASNVLRGDLKTVLPDELETFLRETGAGLIDVRTPAEWSKGIIGGAETISLDELRADASRLSRERKYVLYCGVGYRAYVACRFLMQQGYDVYNLTGGYNAFRMDV